MVAEIVGVVEVVVEMSLMIDFLTGARRSLGTGGCRTELIIVGILFSTSPSLSLVWFT